MDQVSTHSLRPQVYAVRQHHTVDNGMLSRMLHRKIIPAFEMFPDLPLVDVDIDTLMSRPEILSLTNADVDRVEQCLDSLIDLIGVDWVVMPLESSKKVLFAQVANYEYIRYQAHLHIKHYIKFNESFELEYDEIPDDVLQEILKADTLSKFSPDIYSFIQRHKPMKEVLPPQQPEPSKPIEVPTISNPIDQLHVADLLKPARQQVDDQLITPSSLASVSRPVDSLTGYQRLHTSIMALHDYLRTNMKSISEYHDPECDIAFRGTWNDDTKVKIMAYSLSDDRGHNAWAVNISDTEL